jgi:hypothetical protein
VAFDHDDTDALYDQLIEPKLRSNGIIPVIVNRRQPGRRPRLRSLKLVA